MSLWLLLAALGFGVSALLAAPLFAAGRRLAGWALIAGATAAGLIGYGLVGAPDMALGRGETGREARPPDFATLDKRLVEYLAGKPDDVEGWLRLAQVRLARRDFPGGVEAFERAHAIAPERPGLASSLGEARVLAAGGEVTASAREALEAARKADPDDARALYYLAEGDYQAGEREAALAAWATLLNEAPPEAGWRSLVALRLGAAAKELGRPLESLGLAPAALAALAEAARRGPSADQAAAAEAMSGEDRDAFVRAMVEGLAERLKAAPDDAEGWLMLARSYGVLGEFERSAEAYERLAQLDASEPIAIAAARARLVAAAQTKAIDAKAVAALTFLALGAPELAEAALAGADKGWAGMLLDQSANAAETNPERGGAIDRLRKALAEG